MSIIQLTDWSQCKELSQFKEAAFNGAFNNNLGIKEYSSGEIWTQGYIGITRLKDIYGNVISDADGEVILQVNPRFDLDPWHMLNLVLSSEEYSEYINNNPKTLFEIFTNEPPIRLKSSQNDSSQLMVAISFISLCYNLCMKQLKPRMTTTEENLTGKVRGKILIQKQLRKNVFQGREDRVYCRYGVFTVDCIENRILKAALIKAQIVLRKHENTDGMADIARMMHYCFNALDGVSKVNITSSDFSSVKTNGFYSYYKPALELARALIQDMNITIENSDNADKERYVIPFVIKMEALFEFYCREKIKEMLNKNKEMLNENTVMIDYNKTYSVLSNKCGQPVEKIHVMKNVIPDILLFDKEKENYYVFDAKYKPIDDNRQDVMRHDTHQLLSYVLLFRAKRCGFIMPYPKAETEAAKTAIGKCVAIEDIDSLLSGENGVCISEYGYNVKDNEITWGSSGCSYETYILRCRGKSSDKNSEV